MLDKIISFLILLLIFLGTNCGKKGPPLPPILIAPEKVNDLSAHQVGKEIHLTFTLPSKNTNGSSPADINKIIVYRKVEDKQQAILQIDKEDFKNFLIENYFLIIDKDIPEQFLNGNKNIKYFVKLYSKKNKSSEASNMISVKLNPPLEAIKNVKFLIKENIIEITWDYKKENKNKIYFNIYKGTEKDFKPIKPLNSKLLEEASYEDREVKEGNPYFYIIRAVKKEINQESEDSPVVSAEYVDTYAPPSPSEIVAVPSANKIILNWQPVDCSDLDGYKIYRKSSKEATFILLTHNPIKDTYYEDNTIKPNEEYEYYITAVDKAKKTNESPPSKTIKAKLSSN